MTARCSGAADEVGWSSSAPGPGSRGAGTGGAGFTRWLAR
uniref:Uncharacterized protein n=1 Tax=Arundo donax TaxID=35708 RepID=A0A0A9BTN0_ARUDO